uniref:Cathepsin propeptide inhibitor domain-containing protein n=1 Tax=Leersia perrieri TaxID=77586 RepID=A0A0D9WB53_9ORYZ
MARCALAAMALAATVAMEFTEDDMATEQSMQKLYERWCSHHEVARDDDDKALRFAIFKKTVHKVHAFHQTTPSYKMGVNIFADMKDEEVAAHTKCIMEEPFNQAEKGAATFPSLKGRLANDGIKLELPSEIDWRQEGKVTGIKTQFLCGSCWAFAAAAAVESMNAIWNDELVDLSPQQLMDCDSTSRACNGGFFIRAFMWIQNNGGLARYDQYPYLARRGNCSMSLVPTVPIYGYTRVPPMSEAELREAVCDQPVAVAVDSSDDLFQHYTGGIYKGPCSRWKLTHSMLVVGYNSTSSGDSYWILKNSWGKHWGENGYMRLSRKVNDEGYGTCGILNVAAYPYQNYDWY